jgi:hypothetical protein
MFMRRLQLIFRLFYLLLAYSISLTAVGQSKTVFLYEGIPKGSEDWTQQEREMLWIVLSMVKK